MKKINITCYKHGVFKQTPAKHIRGQGCPKCARELFRYNQLTTESFIEKAEEKYGDKYNYSQVNYKSSNIKVKIKCPIHGIFETTPNNHLRNMGNCPKCAEKSRADKRRCDTQGFVKKARKIHRGKYDYSRVNYVSCLDDVKIICPKHGEFLQKPSVHLVGKGCRECSDERHRLNTLKFLEKAKKVHGEKYDYSLVNYTISRKKIKIICSKHGLFEQIAGNHLRGQGCPLCLESHGVKCIASFLKENRINYKREKRFNDCRNKHPLPFDFYIPQLNVCVEFDGPQHFFPIEYFGGIKVFEYFKKSDSIKNNYCSKNNIKLIRISYKKKDSEIISILKKELSL